MIIHIRGMDIDLNNEADLFFLHETLVYEKIKDLESLSSSDIYTKIYKKDVTDTYLRRANTGSWDAYKDIVHTYDEERFENVSEDFTMCWKKTDKEHDKLIILLTSYAGHEGRLTSPLTNVSDKIVKLDTDLLVVNEDPLRYPECLYPSAMVLGVSKENDTYKLLGSRAIAVYGEGNTLYDANIECENTIKEIEVLGPVESPLLKIKKNYRTK